MQIASKIRERERKNYNSRMFAHLNDKQAKITVIKMEC